MVKRTSTTLKSSKALQETPSTILNKKPTPDETVESVPAKKRKLSTDDAKTPKQSAVNPPTFMTEIILPGEEKVIPHVLKLIAAHGSSLR